MSKDNQEHPHAEIAAAESRDGLPRSAASRRRADGSWMSGLTDTPTTPRERREPDHDRLRVAHEDYARVLGS
jgi:hypothetical protein